MPDAADSETAVLPSEGKLSERPLEPPARAVLPEGELRSVTDSLEQIFMRHDAVPEPKSHAASRTGLIRTTREPEAFPTDDIWFGVSNDPFQHFQAARLCAMEQGLPVVRVANTGISGILDVAPPAPSNTPP